jgi:hypothetical protein
MRWSSHIAHVGVMKNAHTILIRSLMRRDHLEGLGLDVRITKDYKQIGFEDVDCIHLNKDTDKWRALMSTVLSLQVP